MASVADVWRTAVTRFLPALLGATVGGLLLTALTSDDALATLGQVNWPLVPVRAVVVGLGFLLALLGVRRGLDGTVPASRRRLALALVATGLPLLVASVVIPQDVVRRGGLTLGIPMDLGAGSVAALVLCGAAQRSARARRSPSRRRPEV